MDETETEPLYTNLEYDLLRDAIAWADLSPMDKFRLRRTLYNHWADSPTRRPRVFNHPLIPRIHSEF